MSDEEPRTVQIGPDAEVFQPVVEHLGPVPIAPAAGIAALALSMALKYHDINTVQDGVLYQQYKMEGRNMRDLQLDSVFETAIRMEMHLMAGSQRIANFVVEALEYGAREDGIDFPEETAEEQPEADEPPQTT